MQKRIDKWSSTKKTMLIGMLALPFAMGSIVAHADDDDDDRRKVVKSQTYKAKNAKKPVQAIKKNHDDNDDDDRDDKNDRDDD